MPIALCTGASPDPTEVERVPSERANERASGLSRQASRKIEIDPLLRLHLGEDLAELDGVEGEVPGPLELGVDGNEIVPAADLHAVAGIEEQREVGARFELAAERANPVLHPAPVEIAAFDHVEAERPQDPRDVGGVVRRIGERIGMEVLAVADDEGDAAAEHGGLGRRGRGLRLDGRTFGIDSGDLRLVGAAASFCSTRAMPSAASFPPICCLLGSRLSATR